MKRLLRTFLSITVILFGIQIMQTSASSTLTVNLSSTLRSVTHCASGSLYGITETLPADIAGLVTPLNPNVFTNPARAGAGYQQPIGAAISVAGRLQNAAPTAKVMIRLADIFPNWPYSFTNMTDWLSKVTSVITDKKASGYTNFYGYEIWNEPVYTWNSSNGDFDSILWKQTYDLIRSLDPSAKIVGPSEGYYNHSMMSVFLTYCKNNNCLPDIISWHELGSGAGVISGNISDYRSLEASLGLSAIPISINEYCSTDHNYEGAPGPSAPFIAKFERNKVDSACISWWFTAYPGRLGSLLVSNTAKGGGWWFYHWYGSMSGNMVSVTPPDDASSNVDGFGCVDSDEKYASICFGGNNDGTVNVVINGIPSFFGSYARVVVQSVAWSSKDTVVSNPTLISQSIKAVSGGSMTVTITGVSSLYGYRIYLTPCASSATTVSSGHTYKLVNLNSGKVLGINNMSTYDGANALQWGDNGTADHNWTITSVNGYYRLTNANSGKVLGVTNMSTDDGAKVIQWTDNGTTDHDWTMTDTGSGLYKLVNRNSGKVLGISDMSSFDGGQAIQWTDNGTMDHLWTLVLVN